MKAKQKKLHHLRQRRHRVLPMLVMAKQKKLHHLLWTPPGKTLEEVENCLQKEENSVFVGFFPSEVHFSRQRRTWITLTLKNWSKDRFIPRRQLFQLSVLFWTENEKTDITHWKTVNWRTVYTMKEVISDDNMEYNGKQCIKGQLYFVKGIYFRQRTALVFSWVWVCVAVPSNVPGYIVKWLSPPSHSSWVLFSVRGMRKWILHTGKLWIEGLVYSVKKIIPDTKWEHGL